MHGKSLVGIALLVMFSAIEYESLNGDDRSSAGPLVEVGSLYANVECVFTSDAPVSDSEFEGVFCCSGDVDSFACKDDGLCHGHVRNGGYELSECTNGSTDDIRRGGVALIDELKDFGEFDLPANGG
jgi:hypothetical protein